MIFLNAGDASGIEQSRGVRRGGELRGCPVGRREPGMSVGNINGHSAHGTVNSANAHSNNTTVQKQEQGKEQGDSVTWADVVKGVARKSRHENKLIREIILSKQSRR